MGDLWILWVITTSLKKNLRFHIKDAETKVLGVI